MEEMQGERDEKRLRKIKRNGRLWGIERWSVWGIERDRRVKRD